jgi:2-hydroxycyclohexanecarboxyl-CoA dehydrogenase
MKNKCALISGAAGGIGAATAELFCVHGAKVLLVDRDEARLTERLALLKERVPGATAQIHRAQVDDAAQCDQAVAQAVEAFGGLDVLVNNAAVRYLSRVEHANPDEWRRLHSVNVLGALNFARAALPALRKRKGSSIVNVSSTYALVGRGDFGAYDATKAALLSLTRTLAHEEASHGIRVNAVCPGGTLTPYTVGRAQARGDAGQTSQQVEEQLRQQPKSDTLLKRWGEEIEVAYPILWLASDEASFVTGAVLPVDGGTSIM